MTKIEKETIIIYNEEEKTADIFTFNRGLQNKLERLCLERSEDVKNTMTNRDGSKSFTVPKKYIKVTAPRNYSDSYRRKLAENAKRMQSMKKNGAKTDEDKTSTPIQGNGSNYKSKTV